MAGKTAQQIQPASTPAERVLQHVEITHAAMEKAAAFQTAVQQKQAAAAARIDAVCDALIANDRVRGDQRAKLAEALSDHASSLELMEKLAAHKTPADAARLGQGQGAAVTKVAGQRNTTDRPFGNAAVQKTAGAILFQRLGLAVPADA